MMENIIPKQIPEKKKEKLEEEKEKEKEKKKTSEKMIYSKFKTGSIRPKEIGKHEKNGKWSKVLRYVFPIKPFIEQGDNYLGDVVIYMTSDNTFYIYLYDDHILENKIKVFVDIPSNITPIISDGPFCLDDPEFRANKKIVLKKIQGYKFKFYPEYHHVENSTKIEDYKEIHIVIFAKNQKGNPVNGLSLKSHRVI